MTARDRTILIVLCVAAAIVAPWLLVISPKRSQASKLGTQLSAAQSQLDKARSQAAANEAARRAFTSSYTTIARLGEAVPSDDDVPSLIYQLQGAAGRDHVDFVGLQTAPGSGSSSSSSSPPSANQASSSTLPPGATPGSNGFNNEAFTFTFQGTFFDLKSFVNRVQRFVVATDRQVAVSGRLLTLNAVNLTAGSKGFPQILATISATTYIAPKPQSLPVSHAPTGSAGAATQPVSNPNSGASSPTAAVTSPVR